MTRAHLTPSARRHAKHPADQSHDERARMRSPFQSQRGVSLIVVLLLLVIIAMLGIGSAQISMMSERGARNDRDMQVALQAAEAALTDAIYEIDGPASSSRRPGAFADNDVVNFEEGCGTQGFAKGLCAQAMSGKPVWQTVDFADAARTVEFGKFTGRAFATVSGVEKGVMPSQPPRYIVEVLAAHRDIFEKLSESADPVYRITAMGFGPRKDIQAVLQLIYRKKKD